MAHGCTQATKVSAMENTNRSTCRAKHLRGGGALSVLCKFGDSNAGLEHEDVDDELVVKIVGGLDVLEELRSRRRWRWLRGVVSARVCLFAERLVTAPRRRRLRVRGLLSRGSSRQGVLEESGGEQLERARRETPGELRSQRALEQLLHVQQHALQLAAALGDREWLEQNERSSDLMFICCE